MIGLALVGVLTLMRGDLGRPNAKAKFKQMFSNNRAVNILAGARIFLFASRDVWFVVGLPVFFRTEHGWTFWQAGGFLAIWTIGYGIVQASAPRLLRGAPATEARAGRHDRDAGSPSCWPRSPPAIAVAIAAGFDPVARRGRRPARRSASSSP